MIGVPMIIIGPLSRLLLMIEKLLLNCAVVEKGYASQT